MLQADYAVIDDRRAAPGDRARARSALLAADLMLIPVQPSAYDVWASHEMVQLIIEAWVFRLALRAAFVINRRVVGTVIGLEARAALADQPSTAVAAEVSQRIIFADKRRRRPARGRICAPLCSGVRDRSARAGGPGGAVMTAPSTTAHAHATAMRRSAPSLRPIRRRPGYGKPMRQMHRRRHRSTPRALTIDVTPVLRGRIKVSAFERGVTTADMLRELLEREFGEGTP